MIFPLFYEEVIMLLISTQAIKT